MIDPHKYSQLILQVREYKIDFQQMDIHIQKKKNLNINFTLITKINSKQITEFNIKCKIIKFIEDNIEGNLDDFGLGNDFSDISQKAQSLTELVSWID